MWRGGFKFLAAYLAAVAAASVAGSVSWFLLTMIGNDVGPTRDITLLSATGGIALLAILEFVATLFLAAPGTVLGVVIARLFSIKSFWYWPMAGLINSLIGAAWLAYSDSAGASAPTGWTTFLTDWCLTMKLTLVSGAVGGAIFGRVWRRRPAAAS